MKDLWVVFDWEICSNVVIFELSKRSVQMQLKHFKYQKVEEKSHSLNSKNLILASVTKIKVTEILFIYIPATWASYLVLTYGHF